MTRISTDPDNKDEKKTEKKPAIKRLHILLAILLGLLLPILIILVPFINEERIRRKQLMENVPKEVFESDRSHNLFGTTIWGKSDLDRIVGVELREDQTEMCGYSCIKYWNNRNVPTEYDDLRFYVFEKERYAKAALDEIKEGLGEITDEGDDHVRGWVDGVVDAQIENYYYVDGNLMVVANVTSISEMARDVNDTTSPVTGGGQEALDLIQLINDTFR